MDSGIDNDDRKGSLTLRSTQKTYDRPVLVCNWYQHREAEPKDYDVDAIPRGKAKNLHRSTYKRFSNFSDGEWMTTTESFMSQINLKDDYRLRGKKPILDMKDTIKEMLERTSGCPEASHYNVIPRHHPDHVKMLLETTYTYDFTPPYHYIPTSEEEPEKITDFRKYHSQFMRRDDYRHCSRNTWRDESDIYPNSELKRILNPLSNPIPNRLK
ncbi:cilia- and flagella-associated protein 95-like [Leucoraja erinacea]|uniref:cilia- and flagella-associated protein 95-like n=1 Tax=Leucoraja erinaceus TaxID=7782 RepID=UPI002453A123|nr:cilia- and flagella-associated protein 95-like [Leucoraja erinacea]